MTETKKSEQPKNSDNNAATTNIQADDDATSTETLSDIEKKEVVAPSGSEARDEDNRSTIEATPDNQFDGASGEGTRGKDDSGPM